MMDSNLPLAAWPALGDTTEQQHFLSGLSESSESYEKTHDQRNRLILTLGDNGIAGMCLERGINSLSAPVLTLVSSLPISHGVLLPTKPQHRRFPNGGYSEDSYNRNSAPHLFPFLLCTNQFIEDNLAGGV